MKWSTTGVSVIYAERWNSSDMGWSVALGQCIELEQKKPAGSALLRERVSGCVDGWQGERTGGYRKWSVCVTQVIISKVKNDWYHVKCDYINIFTGDPGWLIIPPITGEVCFHVTVL